VSCVVDNQQSMPIIFVVDEIRQVPLHLHLRQLRLWAICFACQASLANFIVINILKDSLKLRNLSYISAENNERGRWCSYLIFRVQIVTVNVP